MRMQRVLTASLVAASVVWGGGALAQQTPPELCSAHEKARMSAPQKVEGRVMKVDTEAGKVTVQEADGKLHEFQASKEALQTMKAGDRIEAKLRPAC